MNAHFASKQVEFFDEVQGKNQSVRLQLWDTAGNERFKSITKTYFKGARAAIVVYDVTSQQSIVKTKDWIEDLRVDVPDDCVLCLCGNKIDLVDQIAVKSEHGKL